MNTRMFDQWVEMNQAAMAPLLRWREIAADATEKTLRHNLAVMQDCLEYGSRQMQVLGEVKDPQKWMAEGGKNASDFSLKMMGRAGDYFKLVKDSQEAVGAWTETTAKAAMDAFKTNAAPTA